MSFFIQCVEGFECFLLLFWKNGPPMFDHLLVLTTGPSAFDQSFKANCIPDGQ